MRPFRCSCNETLRIAEAWTAFRCACGERWTLKMDAYGYKSWRGQKIDTVKSLAKVANISSESVDSAGLADQVGV